MKGFNERKKYLITVHQIERPVQKIIKDKNDKVFREFEVIYTVTCTHIKQMKKKNEENNNIIWDVTPEEVSIISNGI